MGSATKSIKATNFACLLPPHLAENKSGLLHLCSFHLTLEIEYEELKLPEPFCDNQGEKISN